MSTTLHGGETVFSSPPPGSGALLALVLNVLDQYRLSASAVDSINHTVTTYHRITEAFKFAFARRGDLGDTDFVSVTEVNLLFSEWFKMVNLWLIIETAIKSV